MEKPAPVVEAEFRVNEVFEVDVTVTGRTVAVFSATLPKLKLEGLTETGPMPLPRMETVAIG